MEEASVVNKDDLVDLPPGFRFHPTDEEIITHYLTQKVKSSSFNACAIGEVDLNKCEPWDLPKRAKMGEKEWYFFCQRDRKYPTGMRTNRATETGYWKATGKDKEIFRGKNCLVGMKKTLVFYKGRAPKGEKSNWVMHEYRLEGKFSYHSLPRGSKDEWVVCRVFHKSQGLKKTSIHDLLESNSYLPPLMEPPPYNTMPGSSSFNNDGESDHQFKPMISSVSSDLPQFSTTMTNQNQNFFHQQTPQSIGFRLPTNNYHHQMQVTNPLYNFQTTPNMNYIQGFQGAAFDASDSSLLRALASNNEASSELLEKQCKVEQLSSNNQSMVSLSQDTGISTDMNTTAEISSKQEIGSENSKLYEALEGPSIGIGDLDQLWYY